MIIINLIIIRFSTSIIDNSKNYEITQYQVLQCPTINYVKKLLKDDLEI